jgi:hypothetical protein
MYCWRLRSIGLGIAWNLCFFHPAYQFYWWCRELLPSTAFALECWPVGMWNRCRRQQRSMIVHSCYIHKCSRILPVQSFNTPNATKRGPAHSSSRAGMTRAWYARDEALDDICRLWRGYSIVHRKMYAGNSNSALQMTSTFCRVTGDTPYIRTWSRRDKSSNSKYL